MTEFTIGEPRWAASQRAVERALGGGPLTREALLEETGLSYKTVRDALARAHVEVSDTWPRQFTLVRSAFDIAAEQVKAAFTKHIEAHQALLESKPKWIIEPVEYDIGTLGIRWQQSREKVAQAITDTDFTAMDRDTVLNRLEQLSAQLLGVALAMRSVEDSPDWREQVGL